MVLSLLLFLQLILTGCSEESPVKLVAFDGPTMGTSYHVKYVPSEVTSAEEIEAATKRALADIDQRMSTYRPDSELMLFNRLPANSSMQLSPDLLELVQISLYLSHISDGGYDVTVGPLVNLWGFGPDRKPVTVPSREEINEARRNVGFHYLTVSLEAGQLHKERDVFIDLSSIAKGYGVDRVAAEMEALGVSSYLVEVGGEVRMKGVKPDGSSWRIGVEQPSLGERQASIVISADDRGVATSGDYRNYFEHEGNRYSHTIDARTGYPIDHKLVSVTVVDESTALADGLATLFMVLGTQEGLRVAKKEEIAAYFIEKTDEGFESHATPLFNQYILNQ